MLATLCWRNIILTAITTLCLLQIILVLLINFRREGGACRIDFISPSLYCKRVNYDICVFKAMERVIEEIDFNRPKVENSHGGRRFGWER